VHHEWSFRVLKSNKKIPCPSTHHPEPLEERERETTGYEPLEKGLHFRPRLRRHPLDRTKLQTCVCQPTPWHLPLWSELGTHKPVKARLSPWLEPFSVRKALTLFKLFPPRSAAEQRNTREGGVRGTARLAWFHAQGTGADERGVIVGHLWRDRWTALSGPLTP